MKKEKQVKSYQRRTKSGKMVTVRAHTAKYDAAEKAMEAAKKVGAGKELEERRKPIQLEIPFDKEEEKKVLDEVKETAKKKTTKKVRPVGSGTNGPEPKRKSSGGEDVSREDEKTQRGHLSSLEKKLTSKESKLSELKYVHSGMKRDNPKKLALAKRIQKLQSDIIETKKAVISQRKVVNNLGNSKSRVSTSEPAFTAAEFKEWYRGTGSAADKKVEKALKKQLGRAGYRKLEDEAIDNYSSRGHLSMFKRVGGGTTAASKDSKSMDDAPAPKISSTGAKNLKE